MPRQNATVLQVPDTTAGAQSVDARFRARNGPEAKKFWVFGRVFKQRILAAKDVETHANIGDDSSSFQAFSGPVEAAVKVFVVVQAEQTFVHACTISTYSGKGTMGRDCDSSKHAIAYTTGTDLAECYLPGELGKGLTKDPIEVKPTRGAPTLQVLSRINFADGIRIKTGIEAMDVGMVAAKHRELLRQYWMECNGDGEVWE
ncbi:hypothetical protein E8E11_010695 [Didymella keratinophila]|nr:hypothetical protein E8E11_010695 [Didymella keratinophila]